MKFGLSLFCQLAVGDFHVALCVAQETPEQEGWTTHGLGHSLVQLTVPPQVPRFYPMLDHCRATNHITARWTALLGWPLHSHGEGRLVFQMKYNFMLQISSALLGACVMSPRKDEFAINSTGHLFFYHRCLYWGTLAISLSLFTFLHWRRKWQPTPVFLPGESQGQRGLVGCRLWGHTESDTTEAT